MAFTRAFARAEVLRIAESSVHRLSGKLPDGAAFAADVRVTKPHALVMLKLLALDDRYRNIRGATQQKHDREEARTHSADCVAVMSGQTDLKQFKEDFEKQFQRDPALGMRVLDILNGYFRENTSPGLLVYEESILADQPLDRAARQKVTTEIDRAHPMMLKIIPPVQFYQLAAGIDDATNVDRNRPLVEDFLGNLKQTATKITDARALERLPAEAFGGAYRKGDQSTASASEALKELSAMEVFLITAHLQTCAGRLQSDPELRDAAAAQKGDISRKL